MRNTLFKCPICGSTHFKHSFPKDKNTPVFLARCSKCDRYECWVHKEDYKNWIYPDRNKDIKNDIFPTQYGKRQLMIHQLLLHFGFKMNLNNKMKYKLIKNNYQYNVDVFDNSVKVKNLETGEVKRYSLESLINKLKNLLTNDLI